MFQYSFPLFGEKDKSKDIPGAGGGYIAFNNQGNEADLNKRLAEQNPMIAAGLTNVS